MMQNLRKEIDKTDDEIVSLLVKRFNLTDRIGEIKKSGGIKTEDRAREEQILTRLTAGLTKRDGETITALYAEIFKLSKARQNEL